MKKILKAGDLRDHITFQRKTQTQLPNGDLTTILTPILSTYAKVQEKSGGYSVETANVNSNSVIEVWIRYRTDIYLEVGDVVEWRGFEWVLENSPVVDHLRTSIYMTATILTQSTKRNSEPENS